MEPVDAGHVQARGGLGVLCSRDGPDKSSSLKTIGLLCNIIEASKGTKSVLWSTDGLNHILKKIARSQCSFETLSAG